jgi:hypothetical protein
MYRRAVWNGPHDPQEMVASIVVLPLIFDGVTFGGFYVTLETTSNFQNIKDLLMGLVRRVEWGLARVNHEKMISLSERLSRGLASGFLLP